MSDTKITISVGDLLEHKGNIIIGCTDVFDTELGDIIFPSSIQGQFQTKIFLNQEKLDLAISEALKGMPYQVDDQKPKVKKNATLSEPLQCWRQKATDTFWSPIQE